MLKLHAKMLKIQKVKILINRNSRVAFYPGGPTGPVSTFQEARPVPDAVGLVVLCRCIR